MTFSGTVGGTITQSGTDTDLSGLSAVAGVVITTVDIRTIYYIGATQFVYDILTINPRTEMLVIGPDAAKNNNGTFRAAGAGSSLTIGSSDTINGEKIGTNSPAIIIDTLATTAWNNASDAGLRIRYGAFNWYEGTILSRALMSVEIASYIGPFATFESLEVITEGIQFQVRHANAQVDGLTLVGREVLDGGTSDEIKLITYQLMNYDPKVILIGSGGINYEGTVFGFSVRDVSSKKSLKGVNVWSSSGRGEFQRSINSAEGSGLIVVSHNNTASHARGCVEGRQELTLTVKDTDAVAIPSAKIYMIDADNGLRENFTLESINYVDDRTYSGTADGSGEWAYTTDGGVLVFVVVNNTTTLGPVNDSGVMAKDRRSHSNDLTDTFDFNVYVYGKLPAVAKISLQGAGGTTADATLLENLIITEAVKATVDAYTTIDTAAEVYDRAAAYLDDNWGTYTELIIGRAGLQIDLVTALASVIVVDSAAASVFDFNGTDTITCKSTTFTAGVSGGSATIQGATAIQDGVYNCDITYNSSATTLTNITCSGTLTLAAGTYSFVNCDIDTVAGTGVIINPDADTSIGTNAGPDVTINAVARTLTITGAENGSTIVIYEGGTQNVLEFTNSSSGDFSHVNTDSLATADFVVLKAGKNPIRVTGVTLVVGTVTQPVSQTDDIEYETPSGDVTLANYGTTWSYNTGTSRLDVVNTYTSTVRNAYSALMDLWIDSSDGVGENPAIRNVAFPIAPEGPKRFTFLGTAEFTATSLPVVSRAGFEYQSGNVYSGLTDRQLTGFAEQWAYQQSQGGAVVSDVGRLDRVVQTDTAPTYMTIKRLANGYRPSRLKLTDTFATLEADQYDFTLPAEALDEGAGTATGITFETGTFVVDGKTFSIRLTSDLSGSALIANLSAYRAGDPSTYFTYPEMVFPEASDYKTLRGFYEDDGTTKGVYVRTSGSIDHPDFLSFQADDGSVYAPPQPTDVTLTLNPGVSAVLVLDDTDSVIQYTDTESGTFNYTIPATASGTWKFISKTKGYGESIISKAADGVDVTFSALTPQDTQPDGSLMYQGTTSSLADSIAVPATPRLLIDIGNGAISPQIAYDTAEDELFTQDGLLYLYAGGGRTSLAVLPGGNYFFQGPDVRLRVRTLGDQSTLNAFAISEDGVVEDTTNGNVKFLSTTDADKIASHQGIVWVDPTSPYSGTSFPIGTLNQPVNNMPDAIYIADELGLRTLAFLTDTLIAQDVSNKVLQSGAGEVLVTLNGANDVSGSRFVNLRVTGDMNGSGDTTGEGITFVGSPTGIIGKYMQTKLATGTLTLDTTASEVHFEDCSSLVAGTDRPTVSMAGTTNCSLLVSGYNGGIEIQGCTDANNDISIRFNAGSVEFDASCTAGTAVVEGVGREVLDNSTGTFTINSDGYNPGVGATPADVWGYATRTLTAGTKDAEIDATLANTARVDGLIEDSGGDRFTQKALEQAGGTSPAELWSYATRSLTATTDANITQVAGVAVSNIDQFKADVSSLALQATVLAIKAQSDQMQFTAGNIHSDPQTVTPVDPATIWSYANRTLTAGTKDTEIDQINAKTAALPVDPSSEGTLTTGITAILAAITGLNDITAQQVWEYATRSLTEPVTLETATQAMIAQIQKLVECDEFFDETNNLLHRYERGTTTDLIPAKSVSGSQVDQDVTISQ